MGAQENQHHLPDDEFGHNRRARVCNSACSGFHGATQDNEYHLPKDEFGYSRRARAHSKEAA